MCLVQGSCVGQGSFSELNESGLDVKSLVSLPESDSDSAIGADDIQVEEKDKDKSTQSIAVKSMVWTWNLVELFDIVWYCGFLSIWCWEYSDYQYWFYTWKGKIEESILKGYCDIIFSKFIIE